LVTATAGALVFWLFDALPFQDLPAHAGFIALRHRFASSPFDQRFFVLAPHLGPYSVFRTLGEALLPLLGPVGAVRAMATLPFAALPGALLWARRRLHGDRSSTAAYYGLSLGFGFMTLLGFASYLLGVAVLVVGLTMWLELLWAVDVGDPGAGRMEVAVACFSPLLFVAHGHAFAIFLALAGVSAVATGRRRARLLRLRALGPAVLLAGWVAWSQRASAIPAGSAAAPNPPFVPHFQGVLDKASLLLTPTLMTRWGIDVVAGLALWAILLGAVFATARATRREREPRAPAVHARALVACLAVLFGIFLVLPHSIGWFGFVDGRLVLVLLLLALMAVRREALPPSLLRLYDGYAPVAAWFMIAIALGASWLFQDEARGWREVLAKVPAESRLLNLPIEPNSRVFTAHPFIHYDKLALAERPIEVSDVWFHQGSALYPTPENPALRLPPSYSESDLRLIDWPAYRLEDWDYVLIRTRPETSRPIVPSSITLAAHEGGWWLFRTH
jgi:hypothetical protein